MDWKLLTFLVCCFGFFKDLRPSEAYLTTYLTSEWKNLTLDQVNNEIYPWWTYSYAIWLIPVFAFTDYFHYRSLLILDVSAYITTWVLILWAQGISAMIVMQVSYGLATAGEIGYFSYLYSMVDKSHFQKVASFTRCSSLAGRFTAYLLGQFIVSYEILDLFQLNAFSFSSVCLAFAISIFLPKAKYKQHEDLEIEVQDTKQMSFKVSNYTKSNANGHKGTEVEKDHNKQKESNSNGKGIELTRVLEPRFDNNINPLENITKQTKIDNQDCDGTVLADNSADHDFNELEATEIDKDKDDTKSLRNECDKKFSNIDKQEGAKDNVFKPGTMSDYYRCISVPLMRFLNAVKRQIKESYSNRTVLIWSAWWVTASCGNLQVGSYIQNLWEVISPHEQSSTVYNGAVEAAGTLIGSVCVALVGFIPMKWSNIGRSEALMTSVCAIKSVILIVMATTTEIWVAYILYGLFRVLYQVAITIETAEIAKALTGSHFGFVFGCNMFLALVIESIFTAVVVDDAGLGVDVRTQFLAYGGYSGVMFIIFLVVTMVTLYTKQRETDEKQNKT